VVYTYLTCKIWTWLFFNRWVCKHYG